MADCKGRKPVIIASLVGFALGALLFGFSVNFAMAFVTRFLTGLFDGGWMHGGQSRVYHVMSIGLVTTTKVSLSEVSDDSSQAFGLTILGAAWGAGYILGPAISGAIADPVGQYNITITSTLLCREPFQTLIVLYFSLDAFLRGYFDRFPYSLPSIFSLILFVFSIGGTICFLPETLGLKK